MDDKSQMKQKLMDCILEVRKSDLTKLKEKSELLLEIAMGDEDNYAIAFAFTYLGEYYITQSETLKSSSYLLNARKICLENDFKELLMATCCFLGVNYQFTHDEQLSFQYNLEALELVRLFGDKQKESVILNNIGVMFQERQDLEEAKKQYRLAYKLIVNEKGISDPHLYGILLVNLSEVYCRLGEPDKALSYIKLLEKKNYNEVFIDMIKANEYHRYAATTGNEVQLLETADFLLSQYSRDPKERFSSFDIIAHVCENMLNIKNKEYSKKALIILEELCTDNIAEIARKFQKLKICYHKIFGEEEELQKAYCRYYEIAEKLEQLNNQIVVNGLKAKIRLSKVLKEKDVIQKLNEDLESVVHLDDLTHLYNRRYFNGLIHKIKHNSTINSVGFIMLDVDYFKEFNDYYGHQEGDIALKEVADSLKSWTYRQLYPCRYGGDEFSCLCINMTDKQIEDYIHNIQNRLEHLAIKHEKSLCSSFITLSIGYCNTMDCNHVNAILENADQALYLSKGKGRNCFTKKEYEEKILWKQE